MRPLRADDEEWAAALLERRMAGRHQARRGELLDALAFPGFVTSIDGEPAGLVTYRPGGHEWELFCIVAEPEGEGVGTALVDALMQEASTNGAQRVWLVTTNNNTRALRFYERRGFSVRAVHEGAVDEARRLKPGIPHRDADGVPIRDEIELERSC